MRQVQQHVDCISEAFPDHAQGLRSWKEVSAYIYEGTVRNLLESMDISSRRDVTFAARANHDILPAMA